MQLGQALTGSLPTWWGVLGLADTQEGEEALLTGMRSVSMEWSGVLRGLADTQEREELNSL